MVALGFFENRRQIQKGELSFIFIKKFLQAKTKTLSADEAGKNKRRWRHETTNGYKNFDVVPSILETPDSSAVEVGQKILC